MDDTNTFPRSTIPFAYTWVDISMPYIYFKGKEIEINKLFFLFKP